MTCPPSPCSRLSLPRTTTRTPSPCRVFRICTHSQSFLWLPGLGDPRLASSEYAVSDLGSRSFPCRRFFDAGRMLESTNDVGNFVCKLPPYTYSVRVRVPWRVKARKLGLKQSSFDRITRWSCVPGWGSDFPTRTRSWYAMFPCGVSPSGKPGDHAGPLYPQPHSF
jgi:hypothetical protein